MVVVVLLFLRLGLVGSIPARYQVNHSVEESLQGIEYSKADKNRFGDRFLGQLHAPCDRSEQERQVVGRHIKEGLVCHASAAFAV